ncbi:hypothetical protein ColLi_13250 [Colletotrichum liriopes]|uniref:Uncharacterized protein n=1 Tax=Colletotrichum liriopes TaxID=708192 RepID=A0AA37H0E5_9PEZI|nr:hypothetical protein ColLi_13250 [Colletotrichum liriopes]
MDAGAAGLLSFSETFRSADTLNLMHFTVEHRKWFAQTARTADAGLQQQDHTSLDSLRPSELLPDEFQYVLEHRSQPVPDTIVSPDDQEIRSVSTTTTDMVLHMGNGQLVYHQRRETSGFSLGSLLNHGQG